MAEEVLREFSGDVQFLLPDSNHEDFADYSDFKPVATHRSKWYFNTQIFDSLKAFPSAIYVLNEKSKITFTAPLHSLRKPCLDFLYNLTKDTLSLNLLKSIKPPTKLNLNYGVRFSGREMLCLDTGGHNIYKFQNEIFRRAFNLDFVYKELDSIMKPILKEEAMLCSELKISKDQIFSNYNINRYQVVNYSESAKSLYLIAEASYLKPKLLFKDTSVYVMAKVFLISIDRVDSFLRVNYFAEIKNETGQKNGVWIDYYAPMVCDDYFIFFGTNPHMTFLKNQEDTTNLVNCIRCKVGINGPIFDSASPIAYVPKFIQTFHGGIFFGQIDIADGFIHNPLYPEFTSIENSKTLKFVFPDSLFYDDKLKEENFSINDILSYFYCYDIRKLSNEEFEIIYRYKKQLYLASISNFNIIHVSHLGEEKKISGLKFIDNKKLLQIGLNNRKFDILYLK